MDTGVSQDVDTGRARQPTHPVPNLIRAHPERLGPLPMLSVPVRGLRKEHMMRGGPQGQAPTFEPPPGSQEVDMRRVAVLLLAGALAIPGVTSAQSPSPIRERGTAQVGYGTMDLCLSTDRSGGAARTGGPHPGHHRWHVRMEGLSEGCSSGRPSRASSRLAPMTRPRPRSHPRHPDVGRSCAAERAAPPHARDFPGDAAYAATPARSSSLSSILPILSMASITRGGHDRRRDRSGAHRAVAGRSARTVRSGP